jgi:CDP-diacylglycerol--serine O-phosphatidyltransferase
MKLVRYKIVIPSMITTVSILCGVFAVYSCLSQYPRDAYTLACWLIIFAAIIDGLDGKVARLTKTSSEFGIQFDSIADIITFGVAATAVLFKAMFIQYAKNNPIFYFFPTFFLICGAIRLARFNITASTKGKAGFVGLPVPTAAGALVSLMLFFYWMSKHGYYIPETVQLRVTVFYTLLVSVLMVSQVKYDISYNFFFGEIRKHLFRSFVNGALFILLFVYPSLAFFAVAAFYILYGIVRGIMGLGKGEGGPGAGPPPEEETECTEQEYSSR